MMLFWPICDGLTKLCHWMGTRCSLIRFLQVDCMFVHVFLLRVRPQEAMKVIPPCRTSHVLNDDKLQCSGRPRFGSVRLRFGKGTVQAVPVFGSGGSSARRVFCVSVQSNRKERFRFRFRFLENGSGGSGSAFGFGKNGSDGSGFRFRFGSWATLNVDSAPKNPVVWGP